MTDKILYFPYIDVPNNSWTVKSLLYWDEVATITPNSYIYNPDKLSDFMKEVLQEGLVTQIFPYSMKSRDVNFIEFLKMLEKAKVPMEEKRNSFKQGIELTKINKEKFNYEIFDFLEEQGVAQNIGEWSDWYFVEKSIANLMMLYLATEIGECNGYIPATDKQENIPLKFSKSDFNVTTDKIRSQILTDILPYPENPNFSQIAKLKENYKTELKSFRYSIENLVFNLASEKNIKHRNQRLESEIYLINQERDRLIEILKESKFTKILKGSIWGIGVDTFATMVAGEIVTLGAGTAISFAKSLFDNFKSTPLKNEKFSYLALLDQKIK